MNQGKREEEIRSKRAYYISIFTNWVSYGTTLVPIFFLNVYYDTITNENNNDWDPETRKDYLSYLCLAYNLGGLAGIIAAFLVSDLNPRGVLNFSRVVIAVSTLFLGINDIRFMLVSRFLSNLFSCVCQITIIWIVYEIYLVRHQSKIMVAVGLSTPSCNFLASFSSKFDTGDAWYWRKILCVMPLALIASTILDLVATKDLNSVTYQLRKKGREKTEESLKRVFSQEYSKNLVQKFGKIVQAENKQKAKLKESGVSQWALDLLVYKHSFINIIVIGCLSAFTFQLQFMSNGLLIGSKQLTHTIETQKTKTALTTETALEMVSYLAVMALNLTKKRKRSLLTSLFTGWVVLVTSSVGYYLHNLGLVRLGIVALSFSFPFFYPALHLYTNDLVPPSLVSMQSICNLMVNTVADSAFPWFFDFEKSSYKLIGRKFAFLALMYLISFFLVYLWMIETDGLDRETVRFIMDERTKLRKNKWKSDGFRNLDDYLATGEEKNNLVSYIELD